MKALEIRIRGDNPREIGMDNKLQKSACPVFFRLENFKAKNWEFD